MLRRCVTLLLALGFAFSIAAQTSSPAAKPDTSQEALVYEKIRNLVRFENDGTGIRDTTAVIRVQSQAGVEEMGQLIFGYSSATEELQIDYVRVRKPDGKTVETSPGSAQDFAPDILKEAPMYSDYRQRHVSVVSLQAGDVLEYHTVTKVKPLASNEFWYEHVFPTHAAVIDESLEIDIPKTRVVKLKSPDHKYEVREEGDRRVSTWIIKDFTPDRKAEREEEGDEYPGPDVQLSTFADWEAIAHWYAGLQGERVTSGDGVRRKAAELTKGAITPAEKTRRLYDYVARNIRYVSLSFGVGRLQPHAASEVLENGYGDCKDKHTLLQSLLRAEGIQSYPVLIGSSRKLDPDVPSPAQFDHVITAVQFDKSSDFTWLDSTAEVAPYGLIMYQLRNKQALLASSDNKAGLRRTVADAPIKNLLAMNIDGKYTEPGAMDAKIEITAQGDSDLPVRMAFRRVPGAQWLPVLRYLSAVWGLAGDVTDVHIDSLEDTGKPFHVTYHFHKDGYFTVPSSGASFAVLPPLGRARMVAPGKKNRSEPIDVGPVEERAYRAHIQVPANYTIHVPSDVRMTRDFGEYSSSYVLGKGTLTAERRMLVKVNELPATRRADFESFRTVTSAAAEQGLWCSITPASASAVASEARAASTPREMRTAGGAALQRQDFKAAVDLLKRSADQDPKQKDLWDDLGRAYAGLNQLDDAIAAFRKQIEIDPYHAHANGDLAAELQQQGKLEDAVAAYRKQVEITPSDQLPHKNLGLLLAQMKRDDEARAELETAASIPPDDAQIKLALAQVYARSGNKEKSEALMKAVTGSGAADSGSDIFASALKDNMDPNEALHDARETLDDIGDHFDSGEYDRLGPSAYSAMNLVALGWARIGWAKFLQGDLLEAMQYMNSAWMLTQSGTIGNRLARVLEKENQRDKARHMFAMAVAAGGPEAQASREQLTRLAASPDDAVKEIAGAAAELLQERTVKLSGMPSVKGSARFALVFEASNQPSRAEYLDGDAALQGVGDKLRSQTFPVRFPDVSSVKIIRRAKVTCDGTGCSAVLLPVESLQP